MSTVDIDYIGLLDYLGNNQEIPYTDPEKDGLDPLEKEKFINIKEKGQAAVAEMKKITEKCCDLFGLDFCHTINWLDGSRTKTRKYLWAQMKYKEFEKNRTSVSLFIEKNNGVARYRISLEIKDDRTPKEKMDIYHSHLNVPKGKEMVYVQGSNQWGNPDVIIDTADEIKDKIKSGEFRKVQLCIYIEPKDNKTNEQYDINIINSIKKIIPYYEYVIGKDTGKFRSKLNEKELSSIDLTIEKDSKIVYDKNTILYGPPGTGKTYSTIIYAVAICDGKTIEAVKDMEYSQVMERYRELKKEGRVAFTTFHQSYGYEEFIEGIKPVFDDLKSELAYRIEPGVFKSFCEDAGKKNVRFESEVLNMTSARVWCVLLDGTGVSDLKKRCFEEGSIRIGWNQCPDYISDDTEGVNDKERRILLNFQDEMSVGDIVVTERSNNTIDGIAVVTGDYEFDKVDIWPRKRQVKWLMKGKEVNITDLNRGKHLDRKSVYELTRISMGKILKLIEELNTVKVTEDTRPYVFIIDEINRGNISKIFGELITLIEDTKREGMNEQANAILPYSREAFSVPSNVYILGTMNTADRSIALMDTALRRRFQFVEMMPKTELLNDVIVQKDGKSLNVESMLNVINQRIEFLFDREHTIGHAFFMKLEENPSIETLASIFQKSVIPLLQEYFYEDYQKIQLVLGDNGKSNQTHKFILDEEVKVKSIFKGNADDVMDLPEKNYTVNPKAFMNIDAYKEIF